MRCVRSYQDIPAAPREKRIAELEDYNKKLLQSNIDNHNKIFLLSQKVNDLQKKNTELGNDMKTTVSLLERSVEISESLTKAKEIIREFMRISKASVEEYEPEFTELIGQAEQFISEVKK